MTIIVVSNNFYLYMGIKEAIKEAIKESVVDRHTYIFDTDLIRGLDDIKSIIKEYNMSENDRISFTGHNIYNAILNGRKDINLQQTTIGCLLNSTQKVGDVLVKIESILNFEDITPEEKMLLHEMHLLRSVKDISESVNIKEKKLYKLINELLKKINLRNRNEFNIFIVENFEHISF